MNDKQWTLYEFMATNPWLTFFLAFSVVLAMATVLNFCATVLKLHYRHTRIDKLGYPPAHCDAYGDLRDVEGDES